MESSIQPIQQFFMLKNKKSATSINQNNVDSNEEKKVSLHSQEQKFEFNIAHIKENHE